MIQDLIFFLFAGGVIGFGALAVSLRNIFHAALCLAAALFSVAGIFIFLGSEFVAVIQLLVYFGAIGILIIFAIMISPPALLRAETKSINKLFFCLATSASLFFVLLAFFAKVTFPVAAPGVAPIPLNRLGELLLTKFVFPFEVIALVLLLAIVGAIIHAWSGAEGNE